MLGTRAPQGVLDSIHVPLLPISKKVYLLQIFTESQLPLHWYIELRSGSNPERHLHS